MIPKALSSTIKDSHDHDHHGHDHSHDHGDCDHGHAQVSLSVIFFGGVLILNSYLADAIYDNPFPGTLSALLGALLLGVPIIWTAFKDVINGRVFMNELVALALLAAFIDSDYKTAGAVAFFMLIAILIEHRTAVGAQTSIEQLVRLTPKKARKLSPDGVETEVEALDLSIGDVIVVRPGEGFPVDGKVVKGITTVNQASITGESLPVDKLDGDDVFAGTQNLTGSVNVQVTKIGSDTTLGQVKDLIQQAEMTKLPIMRMIDRYAGYYLPVILMITGLVAYFSDFNLKIVVAVLVVSCPCALVIATPSAVIAAIASAARLGILIKDVSHLELAAKIKALVFDKTGTLTKGNLAVSKMEPAEGVELAELLKVAVTAESQSNHPAAKAMSRLAEEAQIEWDTPEEFEEVAGKGVVAKIGKDVFRVGRKTWLEELKIDTIKGIKQAEDQVGVSVIYVAKNDTVLGWIGLNDEIRNVAKASISQLNEIGIVNCNMVTGDNSSVAKVVAAEIGIDSIKAECLPHEKVEFVEDLKEKGHKVAVVGDGVNDAPALASGDIGIAMGAFGSDIAINSASIALMNNDLSRIPFLIRLSKMASNVMLQNLLIGLFSIVGGLFLSAIGYLTGVNAAILHTVSTLIIILNSARLVRQGEELEGEGLE